MEKNILHGDPVENELPVTFGQLMLTILRTHGSKILQVDAATGKEISATEILEKSICLAKWMQSIGIKPGDRISVSSENRYEFCLGPIAAFFIGATVAPINSEYTPEEFQHALNLSKPKVIFCSPALLNLILSLVGQNPSVQRIVVFGADPISHSIVIPLNKILENKYSQRELYDEFESPDLDTKETIATILCSSGTTGLPKGVMATQHNMIYFLSIISQISSHTLHDEIQDVIVGLVPFFHSMGFMTLMLSIIGGRKMIILKRFHIKQFLQVLQDYKVTVLGVPPPVLIAICQSPHTKNYDLSSIKEIRCGAAPLPKKFEEQIVKILKLKLFNQAYGMTETTLGVLFVPPNAIRVGSVGKVVPGMMAKVIDESGKALGPNQEGEFCFKGPLIMKGYIGDKTATSATIDNDGWLHTGDVGYYDKEGFFYIVDRLKELIKYKAYQVPPAELEALLVTHPAVLDAAVIGLPDEKAGELPLAYVVVKPGVKVKPKDIQDFVKGRVSSPKQLRGGVRFVESIPRNASGKILRRVLKKRTVELTSKL